MPGALIVALGLVVLLCLAVTIYVGYSFTMELINSEDDDENSK